MSERIVSVAEFSRLTGYTPQHVYLQLRVGRIPGAQRIDGEWSIPLAEAKRAQQRRAAWIERNPAAAQEAVA